MADRQKTTVYLEADAYQKLKFVARESGVAPAEMIRTAISEFLERRAPRRLPRSLGAGRSKSGNVAARAEEFLKGVGKS
jgi:predicted transcriptional regulator